VKIKRPQSRQPLPSNAKCVFKGILYDVYQWNQEQFDGSFKTFEKLKRTDTAQVIPITKDKRIVLTEQRQPGKFSFVGVPGGRVDEGEDVFVAAKRELLEESGYESARWELWDAIQPSSKIEWAVFTFLAKDCEKTTDINPDEGEKIKVRLVNFDEFVELVSGERFYNKEITRKILLARTQEQLNVIKERFLND